MFVFKLILTSFFISLQLSAYELNVEISIPRSNEGQTMSEQDILIRGKEEAIREYIKAKSFDNDKFQAKLALKKNSKNRFDDLLNNIFTDTSVYYLSDLNAKNISKAVFKGNLDETKFDDFYAEIIYDLESLGDKKIYYQLNIELLNSLTFMDLGVLDSALFKETILNTWNELLRKFIEGYSNIEVVDDKFKIGIEKYPNKINPNSVFIEVKVQIKKTNENKTSKKTSFEINAQYLILKASTKEIIYSFSFPIQKKELSITNKKDLNSTFATLIYNLVKVQAPTIAEAIKKSESQIEMIFDLKGQELFSDVSKAQNMLDTFLKEFEVKVEIKQLSLSNSVLVFKLDQDKKYKVIEKLKAQGKLPLTLSNNEQKFLILNENNNSFAIVKKD